MECLFCGNERHVFLCTSSVEATHMWCVRDLDLGTMTSLSRRVNKTWQNTKQVAYVENLYHGRSYMALVGIYHHRETLRFSLFFQKNTSIIILIWNKIITSHILLSRISQQLGLSYGISTPQSLRFMMVSYEPKSPNLEEYQDVN
jgi:hypothetical protein